MNAVDKNGRFSLRSPDLSARDGGPEEVKRDQQEIKKKMVAIPSGCLTGREAPQERLEQSTIGRSSKHYPVWRTRGAL